MLNTGGQFVKQLHDVILTGGSPTFSKLMFKVEQSLFKFGVIILGLQPPLWILDVFKETHSPHRGHGGVIQSTSVFSRQTQFEFRSLKQFLGPQSTWLHLTRPLIQRHLLQFDFHISFSWYVLLLCLQPWKSTALSIKTVNKINCICVQRTL